MLVCTDNFTFQPLWYQCWWGDMTKEITYKMNSVTQQILFLTDPCKELTINFEVPTPGGGC